MQRRVAHDDVATLAVLACNRSDHLARLVGLVRDKRLVVLVVERIADVVLIPPPTATYVRMPGIPLMVPTV